MNIIAAVLFLLGALSAEGVVGVSEISSLAWALAGVAAYVVGGPVPWKR